MQFATTRLNNDATKYLVAVPVVSSLISYSTDLPTANQVLAKPGYHYKQGVRVAVQKGHSSKLNLVAFATLSVIFSTHEPFSLLIS
jgi:hypothetical protein